MEVAQALLGTTENNMLPAYEGIMSVLNNNCSVPDLVKLFEKCPKLSQRVIPKVLKEQIRNFEKSDSNFIRSVNVLYRGGIASKQKYISIKSSLSMCMNENGVGKKHIEFVKKIPVPRLFKYQKLMARVNQINIGDLYDVKD